VSDVAPAGRVAWYDLAGHASSPPLLMAHATGFHGRMFAPVAAALSALYRCVAFDERGHGDTPAPDDGVFDWHGFAADALDAIDAAGLERPFGVGHSAGGAALLLAEIARPGTFRAIYCYEPIVAPVDDPSQFVGSQSNPLAASARKRRATFPSKDEAYENYASKPPMMGFHPDALRAYVDHGFRELPGGSGVTLKCDPEHEARTYEMGMRHGAYSRFGEITCPVTIAWGSETTTFGPDTFVKQAEALPHGRTEPLAGLGHFGPFEDPERIAASVRRAFAE
jgi:pimeloyl-ACP methyl ester carboxylesterase